MKLSSIFLGAALLWGGLAGPGFYYQQQDTTDTVRAKVTGKVETVEDPVHSYRRYEIHTSQGTFNTYRMLNGDQFQPGLSYEFKLHGAKVNFWPPSYTRNIESAKPITPVPAEKGPGS